MGPCLTRGTRLTRVGFLVLPALPTEAREPHELTCLCYADPAWDTSLASRPYLPPKEQREATEKDCPLAVTIPTQPSHSGPKDQKVEKDSACAKPKVIPT